MNAEQHRTSTLATQWLRHTDAGEQKLAAALTTVSQRTQAFPVSHLAGSVSAIDHEVRIWAQIGSGNSAAGLSVASAVQGPAETKVSYDIGLSVNSQPRPLDTFTDVGVLADRTRLDPEAIETIMSHLGQAARLVAFTAYQHVAEVGEQQIQAELAPQLGAAREPSPAQIDTLSALVEEHARSQAALDLNAAYVQLTQAAQPDQPDRFSPAGLANQMGADVQVEIDYKFSELIIEHWRRTYTSALNDALGVVPAIETPTEKAMHTKLAEQAERDAAQSAFPQSAKDQLHQPPAADRDDPPPPPNPFNQWPNRDPDGGRDDDQGR